MKKKVPVVIGIIALMIVGTAIWWFSPKSFLANVEEEEIAYIEVFNGNDGNQFTISEPDDIFFLTDSIKSVSMKKDRISMGMGTTYNLRFLNAEGNEIDKFIIMTSSTIRKGIVFYECDGELEQVEDYLINLEKVQFPDTPWLEGQK